ncbi:MAG: hypothetical protein IT210_24040 [Armatimonadetes bacterium]|nr:hypothetical protein [Armatimonadota bacterium]
MIQAEIDFSLLHEAGEYLAAGYFEEPAASPVRRFSRGLRRHFERSPLPPYRGETLYPSGAASLPAGGSAVYFSYWSSLNVDSISLREKIEQSSGSPLSDVLREAGERLESLYGVGSAIPIEYALGGRGYTHSIINYGRVLSEGLDGYSLRLERCASATDSPGKLDFYAAMRDLLAGLRALQGRTCEHIGETIRANPSCRQTGERLLSALGRVPREPASSFYEAMAAANFLWYLDGCDNLGRFDQDLGPYLEQDISGGRISRAGALELVRLLWRNVDANSGWNAAIGGTNHQGRPGYNLLTDLCLEAAAGMRRPSVALRVRKDMPDAVFERAALSIATGCGLPALYNEEAYLEALPHIFDGIGEDACLYAFGGCTETMVHGCSNVGSIDGGINLLSLLPGLVRDRLASSDSFETFLEAYLDSMREAIAEVAKGVNRDQRLKAENQPQPLRSLLIDDCLERGTEYNAGGARYNTGVINLGGLANVADSLAALKELVFEGEIPAADFLAALDSDFTGCEPVRRLIQACPKFGNDDDRADAIAVRVAEAAFRAVRSHRAWRGNTPFEPACIMFVTYAGAGQVVKATPDGRRAGDPISDSIGPVQGRDTHGPTAMLASVGKLSLSAATGTPILNIRLAKELFATPEGRRKFRSLVRGFFDLGGMQIQVSVIDQAVLKDAIARPERHEDLIVRIGGYSEYFNRLSPELKISVLERTEHL